MPGRRLSRAVSALVFLCVLAITVAAAAQSTDTYTIVHTYPHDAQAFTQGLVYADDHLYESTGLVGHSSLRSEDVETGRIVQFDEVPPPYFAEGLTDWKNTLIQLTWKSHVVLVYDRATLRLLRTLPYPGEGWGITQDGTHLIVTDGSDGPNGPTTLHFLDPETLREIRKVKVTDHGKPATELNELEFIHGDVYANIWHSNRIARIAPATGKVLGWIDLTGLEPTAARSNPEAVLNGIAYDAVHDRLLLTGKLWPNLFEIKVIPTQKSTGSSYPRK